MLKVSRLFLHEKLCWYTFLHGYVLVHIYVQLINSFVGNSAILLRSFFLSNHYNVFGVNNTLFREKVTLIIAI